MSDTSATPPPFFRKPPPRPAPTPPVAQQPPSRPPAQRERAKQTPADQAKQAWLVVGAATVVVIAVIAAFSLDWRRAAAPVGASAAVGLILVLAVVTFVRARDKMRAVGAWLIPLGLLASVASFPLAEQMTL